jgi:O-succinylbenzoate synthase
MTVPVRIERLRLRLVRLPLVAFFETSFGRIDDRTFIIVQVDGDGVDGLGECVADVDPYYSPETNVTAWHVMKDFLAPLILGRSFAHPRDVFAGFARVRGHNMAKAAIEMAAWDLAARAQCVPLARLLGGTRSDIASGVSIGIQDSLDQLARKVETELAAGYRRIKIKIRPGWDASAVEMIRSRFGQIPLMVDANAAYSLEQAPLLASLDAFGLMMIEQPLDYEDIRDHARLQAMIRTPICLDESIHTPRLAEDAIALGACRIINIKPGRLGGHQQSVRVHDIAAANGVPVWHGGMLESGIGRAHNIHLASLPNFTLPGDIAASTRYFVPDLIEPGVSVSSNGTIAVPMAPGIGVSVDWDRVEAATLERWELTVHG